MIAGSISAQKPSTKAQAISRNDFRGGLAVSFATRDPPPGEAESHAEHQSREDAGQEQLRDRHAAGNAEQHKADAWRNHGPDDAAGGDEPCRIHLAVAAATIMGTSRAASAAASAAADPDREESTQAARIVT